jgi:hypothetical protein
MVCLLACLPEVPRGNDACIEQEDDDQSNVTFEGIDVVDVMVP